MHALGAGTVVFEVQENSDVTFRLYDWDNIDPATGKQRPLQVEKAISCVDFGKRTAAAVHLPRKKAASNGDVALDCRYFRVTHIARDTPASISGDGMCHVCVLLDGEAVLEGGGTSLPCRKGDVILLAAGLGTCWIEPRGRAEYLDIVIPEAP